MHPKNSSLPVVTAGTLDEVVFIRRRRERKTPLSALEGMRLMWAGFFFLGSWGIWGHFFGYFPSVDVVTPNIPGGVILVIFCFSRKSWWQGGANYRDMRIHSGMIRAWVCLARKKKTQCVF
jgi:hypothetical protein